MTLSLLSLRALWRSAALYRGGCLAGLVCVAGCSSVPTSYYALAPQEGTVLAPLAGASLPAVIEVRTPSIEERLDRDGIVQGMAAYQDHMIPAAAWSEPPNEMVGHILTADLAQRLPGHVLFSQNDSVAVPLGAYIEVSLSRFEQGATGHVLIEGILSARHVGAAEGQARAVAVHWVSPRPIPRGQKVALVAGLSEGVGAMADQAVQLLRSLPSPAPTDSSAR